MHEEKAGKRFWRGRRLRRISGIYIDTGGAGDVKNRAFDKTL